MPAAAVWSLNCGGPISLRAEIFSALAHQEAAQENVIESSLRMRKRGLLFRRDGVVYAR